ncbi:MAG: hypothetical protein H6729_01020 [Deltaproteobacteria bacterium]|nr:hypothetical protein [Deltaproteobacteria bacterium]
MALRIQQGHQINSPNVDSGRQYISGRNIDLLGAVGIPANEVELMRRADGTSERPDGNVSTTELKRMEKPEFAATLFPEELGAQAGLWKRLEWNNVSAAPRAPKIASLASMVKDVTPEAVSLDFGRQYAIADLPESLRRTAERVQLVLNGDANAGTISLADIAATEHRPVRFSTDDRADLAQIAKVLGEAIRAQPSNIEAKVQIPALGVNTIDLTHSGQVDLKLQSNTTLREERIEGTQPKIELDRQWSLLSTVPSGHKALLIRTRSGQGVVLEEGTHARPALLAGGTYRVELWRDGERVESSDVEIPFAWSRPEQLSRFAGYTFETAEGETLARNVTSATRLPDGRYAAQFSYDRLAQPAEGVTAPFALTQVASSAISLPSGRYEVPLGLRDLSPAVVDVFGEQRAIRVKLGNGETYNLTPQDYQSKKWFELSGQPIHLSFRPETNKLIVGTIGSSDTQVVTPEMRVA